MANWNNVFGFMRKKKKKVGKMYTLCVIVLVSSEVEKVVPVSCIFLRNKNFVAITRNCMYATAGQGFKSFYWHRWHIAAAVIKSIN